VAARHRLNMPATQHSVQNVDELYQRRLSRADSAAIAAAAVLGSWRFIIGQSVVLTAWVVLNVVGWMKSWDPYPFILMNLVLSLQAAYTAPLVLMAQNRDLERDRLVMQEDYETNRQAAEAVKRVLTTLEQQGQLLAELLEQCKREGRPRA